MKLDRDKDKNERLINERWVSFEDVVLAIEQCKIIANLPHPNNHKYPHQFVVIVLLNDYPHVVPYFIENEETIVFKTIIPNRKYK